ncbi:MAG: type II secretion system GspH family protein [Candidatus Pacebacteria bacterium]|nr:type II secretion system GspH family protein [Candidatus Paceibacterota bacterium]MCF7862551.1 type II secretion system GspH family protein [Candidatus Paceibacterota bacterium]
MKKTIFRKKNKQGGFTVIETMIATSVFLIVILYGMGTLLNANLLQSKSENMRSIMDSLSFVMDEMSRNIRTGYDYSCFTDKKYVPNESCYCSNGIAFTPSTEGGGSVWAYYIDENGALYKSVDGVEYMMTPSEIVLDVNSGFSIVGAELPPENKLQPMVRINLEGKITEKNIDTPFSLQTVVSQRLVDR